MSASEPLENAAYEQFAQSVVSGIRPKDAYGNLHPDSLKKSWQTVSARWMQKKEIADRIEFLKQQNAENSGWSRSESMSILKDIARDDEYKPEVRVKAIEVLNDMCGFNEVKKSNNVIIPLTFISPELGKDQPRE